MDPYRTRPGLCETEQVIVNPLRCPSRQLTVAEPEGFCCCCCCCCCFSSSAFSPAQASWCHYVSAVTWVMREAFRGKFPKKEWSQRFLRTSALQLWLFLATVYIHDCLIFMNKDFMHFIFKLMTFVIINSTWGQHKNALSLIYYYYKLLQSGTCLKWTLCLQIYTILCPDVLYWLFFDWMIDWTQHSSIRRSTICESMCLYSILLAMLRKFLYVIYCCVFWSTQEQFSLLIYSYFSLFDDWKQIKD